MLPEIRTLVERAATQRALLDDLLDAVPDGYWPRRAAGEAWSARQHLEHLATIERLLREDVGRVREAGGVAWIGGSADVAEFAAAREAALAAVADESTGGLREQMAANRGELVGMLAGLNVEELELAVAFPGVVDSWGGPLRWSLRRYLAAWPAHDVEHAAAIRAALATPPDLSTIAITRRLN